MTESLLAAVAEAVAPTTAVTTSSATLVTAAALQLSPEALAQAKADGMAEGRKLERARAAAILGSDEAKGREKMAAHLAFASDLDATMATALLAVAPKAEAPKGGSRLDALVPDFSVTSGAPPKADADVVSEALFAAIDSLIKRQG